MSEKRKREERSESPEEESRLKAIAASKLQAYTVGRQKKSAYERHKEETDLKKQQESLEAAKVYAEFVASFQEPTSYKLGTSSFVKAGTLNPATNVTSQSTLKATTTAAAAAATKSTFKAMPFVKAGESMKPFIQDDDDDSEEDELAKLKKSKAQKRNLDTFLEEIKKEQQVRSINKSEHTIPTDDAVLGDGDSHSTNLYVGNIHPTVTEMGLCHEFGKFGPIASVKIMWPRTLEEKEKGRNNGFVCFMNREDAAEAIKGLNGIELEGFKLRVGWGKAVPLPAEPVFVLEQASTATKTGLPFNAQIDPGAPGVNSRPRAVVNVVKPTDIQVLRIIHRVVERVIEHGPMFEEIIMSREQNNTLFKFLFDNTSPEHVYYRWRLYSMLQGDTKSRWNDEPFQMFEGGAWWIPPELPFIDEYSEDPAFDTEDELAENENVAKGTLGKIAKQRLAILLREVTFQRGTIARAMAFAIDHSDAATEIVNILCKSILVPDSPLSAKLARLYLVSDILHNSSVHVSNAWKYRKEFETQLPLLFDHFNSIYRSINARLKAEQMRKYISSVISVWENWMIFPKYYTDQLKSIFLKKDGNTTHQSVEEEENIDGEPIENDDVDGEPIDDDVDGEPIDDDFDGEPMQEDETIDDNIMKDNNINGETLGEDPEIELSQIDDMFCIK
ncbi:hypothetical protein G6F57_000548 [Rhizopus arrhizus]|uniref:U2 snRNP-associated SURP motif-containing protein n=1 Tax=Rhizopus oryzae TaxID=64495 RepID=A0A9P7BPD7_RHIOR|nr:hypothetical protein G6F24_009740 [Rhizopus arrhizus]KAG1414550.1 hypothetical protein G6F58_006903 [Rhizopus delemar]KAG0787520.1 hypothetical protein G6F21_007850 [Rhizopus arrhizus]KAG0807660.1 hypothetical protein G6F20_010193 [Rhizopus arrhizus]KAG0825752.1 hypothetical protein G6F18_010262 [Rhizopus arrhizus]